MSMQLPVNYITNVVFYSVGDVFRTPNHGIGVLAQISNSSICMIMLEADCNRWVNPVEVANIYKITENEFNEITQQYKFSRIGKLV